MYQKAEGTVTIPKGEKLRILQLTDMQIIDASQRRRPDRLNAPEIEKWDPSRVEENCYSHIRSVVTQTDPHLILLTGDLTYGEFDDSGRIFRDFIRFMESLGIPWAPVWGNHDQESAIGNAAMCRAFEEAEHCLFRTETIHPSDGTGNYAIRIYQGKKLIEMVYLLDSHGCKHAHDEEVRIPQSITENQMIMVEERAIQATAEAGKRVPGIVAFHIPTADFFEAYQALGYPYEIGTVIGVTVPAHRGDFGAIFEKDEKCASRPDRFAQRLKQCGVNAVFVGHNHNINTSVFWNGIRWTMGMKCGTYDYHINGALGGTLIEFVEAGVPSVHHIPMLAGY